MSQHAFILVDLQNDYFPNGRWPLNGIDEATANARAALQQARQRGDLVIHVRHEFLQENPPFFSPNTEGAQIHENLRPLANETVVLKHYPNAFRETALKAVLDEHETQAVTIVGAMSHMCIDATARSAADFEYQTTVIADACATRDLEFNGHTVAAADVHAAYMSALAFGYAQVINTQQFLTAEAA